MPLTPLAAQFSLIFVRPSRNSPRPPEQISPPRTQRKLAAFFVADAFLPIPIISATPFEGDCCGNDLLSAVFPAELAGHPYLFPHLLYPVSLGTAAETVEKLTLRIAGCLLGAVIGIAAIVFVTPHLTSIGELMALVFAGAVVAGWVAAGTPRISYAGFQIAFAFFLCIIQDAKPEFDLVTARDRIIGILLGNVVVYLIFTNLWPVSVKARIDEAAASLLQAARQDDDRPQIVPAVCCWHPSSQAALAQYCIRTCVIADL